MARKPSRRRWVGRIYDVIPWSTLVASKWDGLKGRLREGSSEDTGLGAGPTHRGPSASPWRPLTWDGPCGDTVMATIWNGFKEHHGGKVHPISLGDSGLPARWEKRPPSPTSRGMSPDPAWEQPRSPWPPGLHCWIKRGPKGLRSSPGVEERQGQAFQNAEPPGGYGDACSHGCHGEGLHLPAHGFQGKKDPCSASGWKQEGPCEAGGRVHPKTTTPFPFWHPQRSQDGWPGATVLALLEGSRLGLWA